MTLDQVDLIAYNEARLDFISRLLDGFDLESANEKHKEVFENSRRARCSLCLIEKHVDEFYRRGVNSSALQSYCKPCALEFYRVK